MPRPKSAPRPPSPNQIVKAARDLRRAARQARQAAQTEIAALGLSASGEASRATKEFAEWRAVQADKRAYLAERKRLRDEEPTTLLAQEIELKKTALARAKYTKTLWEQERSMADMSDPDEREAVQIAQTRAEDAAREYRSLAATVSRRQKQVDRWLAALEEKRHAVRTSAQTLPA